MLGHSDLFTPKVTPKNNRLRNLFTCANDAAVQFISWLRVGAALKKGFMEATTKETARITFLLFLLSIPASLFGVFVGMKIWNMFMPALFGLPALAFWKAYGLRLAFWAFGEKGKPGRNATNSEIGNHMLGMAFAYSIAWGIAALISGAAL